MPEECRQQNPDICEFLKIARRELTPDKEKIGLVIYSKVSTLAPGNVVFWGFNPGQDPSVCDATHWTIEEALEKFETQTESLLDQVWPNAGQGTDDNGEYRCRYPAGRAPYQTRTRHLLNAIDHRLNPQQQPRDDNNDPTALVSNFLFLQTGNAEQARNFPNIGEIVHRCWCVHEAMLDIVKPKVIITTPGVLGWIRRYNLMTLTKTEDHCIAGHGNWCCRRWQGNVNQHAVTVLQIPHVSRWACDCRNEDRRNPVKNEARRNAVEWLADQAYQAVNSYPNSSS